ncbi:MAG: universal stress protein [Nitrospinota bacterium]
MYETIYVPVDNSENSNRAVDLAIALARWFRARLVGSHVYAAKLHAHRFKQMEFTLPGEYRKEKELRRQRTIHDSLISMGLRLISNSYLDAIQDTCQAAGVPFERKILEGRHYRVLLDDIQNSRYDLVVMGALGMGAGKGRQLGSVCERVVRKTTADVLVVKELGSGQTDTRRSILVGIDGSPQSFGALKAALALSRAFGRPVEAVGVYDPYLHSAMFKSIAGVLSEKGSKVFRFEDQERLHEEITDAGIGKIYQSHLQVAKHLAEEEEIPLTTTLLDGKAFEGILKHARQTRPWLLILGRIGIHGDERVDDLGSAAENLLRLTPCNLFLTGQKVHPPMDVKAEETVAWSQEALERMSRVPSMVQGMARTAVLRYAIEQGHSVVTSDLIDAAMGSFMPSGTVASAENETEGEKPSDGVDTEWSGEAQKALGDIPDAYLRRRSRARIEKTARMKRLENITLSFVEPIIEDTMNGSK